MSRIDKKKSVSSIPEMGETLDNTLNMIIVKLHAIFVLLLKYLNKTYATFKIQKNKLYKLFIYILLEIFTTFLYL